MMPRSSPAKLWIAGFLLCLLSIPVFAGIEKLKALPLLQLGSGLRVVGIGHKGTEMIGSYLLLRNRSEKRIVGFGIVFTAGVDERLDPGKKGDPEIIKRSGYFSVVLNPGDEYELFGQGPNFKDVVSLLKDRGSRFGLLRVGVSRVVYADGTEQNFDILKDEGTRRSEPPVDTGGQARVNPSKRPATDAGQARFVKARFSIGSPADVPPCSATSDPSGAIPGGRVIHARAVKSASPHPCNWMDCLFTCLDPPACDEWVSMCTPDGAWECTIRCWTISCIL